ncbi:Vps5-domain-containing protein [Rickenella mellea]|uniref:Vps5-domain-containing protein n=1 Tax=Rickenella mellea TaxID=50990 RepID=A0A4Y7Q8R8_9AGAM|nr:Vps5-domain-containing protein [Rickenella mellea]
MDGFDDLLKSSGALEDNPFSDPFANPRSGSPDPWATFGAPSTVDHVEGFGSSHMPDSPYDSHTNHSFSAPTFQGGERDVLQSSVESDQHRPLPDHETPQSPGFRESVDAEEQPPHFNAEPTSPTPTPAIPNTPSSPLRLSEKQPESVAAHERRDSVPAPSTVTTRPVAQRSASPPPTPPPASLDSVQRIVSPLDNTASATIERSFASLALGGESVGGWQDSGSSFINDQSSSVSSNESTANVVTTTQLSQDDDSPTKAVASPNRWRDLPQSQFSIRVDDPQKVGDPIRPFIMYTVHTRTTCSLFTKASFSVLRRYSDFLWLYDTLTMNNPGVIVPPVPGKSPFGRFENQFVQQRRLALERCIQKIANHPILFKDQDFRFFLESDTFALDIKQRKAEIAQERGGLMSSIGQTIAGPKFYEMDDWFDARKAYLDSLESQLKGLVKAIDVASKQRAELATAIGEFAQTVGDLSTSDLGKQLAHSLSTMSDVEKKAQDLQQIQAQEDVATFMSIAEEYARIINSVRNAFSSRIRCYNLWQNADSEVRRVKQAHEKARSQGRIPADRLGHSLSQIADAERKALDSKQEFDRASNLIKAEMRRFEEERVQDFKVALEEFLGGMISRQKELISSWESFQEVLLKKASAQRIGATADQEG